MKKQLICVFILFLLPLLANCSGRVEGVVYLTVERSGTCNTPIADVTITVTNNETDVTASDVTASNGVYVVDGLKKGVYDVKVSKTGFQTDTYSGANVEPGKTYTLDFRLKKATVPSMQLHGMGWAVNADTITVTVSATASVLNVGDCAIYGPTITVKFYDGGSALVGQAVGVTDDNPILPEGNSEWSNDSIPVSGTPVTAEFSGSFDYAPPWW